MGGGGSAPVRRDYGGRSVEQRRTERRDRLLAAGLELFGTEVMPRIQARATKLAPA